jgi:glycosyltransferase involved in cell wall biosynthesis
MRLYVGGAPLLGLRADPPARLTVRILHLTPEIPHEPGGGGGRTLEYFRCRRLLDLGHDVLNVSPAYPEELVLGDSLRDIGAENWLVRRPASALEEVARAVAAEPGVLGAAVTRPVRALEMRVFWTRMRETAQRAVREWRPDVAIVGHDMAAAWVRDLPRELPAVLTLQNLTWRWYSSRARRTGGPGGAVMRFEAARFRHHVLGVLPRFGTAVAISTLEAAELLDLGVAPHIELIPAGVDTQRLTPAPEETVPPAVPRVLFTGTMSYQPNHQGIRWFADEVWPTIRAAVPGVELDVVGKDPPAAVRALDGRDGITVHGFVPSMAPFFARSHVVVVPILTGAGIRVKILEAMAAGRPIVSTTLGWEGLPYVEPGRHLLVADAPEPFARHVLELLTDAPRRQALAADARSLAEDEYDWRALGDRLAAVLEREVARGRQAA